MKQDEIQKRIREAKASIGAAMTMLFFGKIEQALGLLKEALTNLSAIDREPK